MITRHFFSVAALLFIAGALAPSAQAAYPPGFLADPSYYPSSLNANFLPNGTLVKTAASGTVYYIKDGTRSMILPRILEVWFQEAHYLKSDLITTISDADMKLYVQTKSVNPLYIGKILKHPDGRQFFIDDKLRKRPISGSVRAALRFPGRNSYPTSAAHLDEFPTGLPITRTDIHPGGTVMYNGLYHGGTVWRIEQGSDGVLRKRLYLQDYIYETEGYPWSGQIMSVSDAELARYARGTNIERYPDGVVVSLNNKRYVVQKGRLRHIASQTLFDAMGYKQKYALTVYPEFLRRYPVALPIAAFKKIVVPVSASSVTTTVTTAYPELRPAARDAIARINDLFLVTYDRQITADENRFWLSYVYRGEVGTKEALLLSMQKAKSTGVRPALTSYTASISRDLLKSKWFPYLFYFVWRAEPSGAAKAYWYGRIDAGNWSTIEGLGGTIRYMKDTLGLRYK